CDGIHSNRLANRVQLTTDGLKAYLEAVEGAFGADVDYAVNGGVKLGHLGGLKIHHGRLGSLST
ncbi:MAG: hypothetical protein O7A66_10380, partial [Alphaproteobacteria bacterium]|nr:hypothetical protein [Alphaproteobacteria bacterium]